MTAKIVASSPAALELAKNPDAAVKGRKAYPFDDLAVGQSFTLPLADANLSSLKVIASRKNKDGAKKFVVIEHETQTPPLVEVARIA